MCGIAGMVGDIDPSLLRRMLDAMRHRGPDDLGVYVDDRIGIGQTRLSIIDVTGGHQPILDEDGTGCIVANGEIYNHRRIASTLTKHTFRTCSDTEVVIHLYEDVGPEVASHLDGMFAIAVWDGEFLYLARDPVGIKPLYYAVEDGTFYFASEIKGLLPASRHVREFPNGHFYRRDVGFVPYAPWLAAIHADWTEVTARDRLRQILPAAVEKRLMSDVPLGAFCSGGLDSTLVTALAVRSLGRLHTFSTGLAGAPDVEMAGLASDALGTEHHVREFTEDEALRALPEIAWHLESFDAALFRSAVPTYFVSELARRYVTVVLTGEGADELYAGYSYLKAYPDEPSLHSELVRSTQALHHSNLQRTDRMTMAHSLEGRVPYLDWDHIRFALSLPTHLKIRQADHMEKWILRKAFEDILPKQAVWRGKQKFAEGTGSADIIRRHADRTISNAEFERESDRAPVPLQTKEELLCYRLFQERFDLEAADLPSIIGRTPVY